jgi:hypothetical protein
MFQKFILASFIIFYEVLKLFIWRDKSAVKEKKIKGLESLITFYRLFFLQDQ